MGRVKEGEEKIMQLFLGNYFIEFNFKVFKRKCWNCGIEKLRSEFNKDHTRWAGIQYECITCQNLRGNKLLKGKREQSKYPTKRSTEAEVKRLKNKMKKVERVIRI